MNEAAASSPAATPLLVQAALLAVSLLFGANTVVAKVALREVSPLDLVVIRTAGTAAILFAASSLRRRAEPRRNLSSSDLGQLLLYSLLGASINQIFFLEGLARSTATNASPRLPRRQLTSAGAPTIRAHERPFAASTAAPARCTTPSGPS